MCVYIYTYVYTYVTYLHDIAVTRGVWEFLSSEDVQNFLRDSLANTSSAPEARLVAAARDGGGTGKHQILLPFG
jgi:hypothetical protein